MQLYHSQHVRSRIWWALAAVIIPACQFVPLQAQVASSAYRALGQPDLRQNGVNRVQGAELNGPAGIAFDLRQGHLRLYVADTRNHRVLAWQEALAYQTGEPATLVLGQPSPQHSGPLGIGAKGFVSPLGLTVDPSNGNLYVADFGNNRVLRFPDPFANPTRVEPDAVYGQPNFTSRNPNPSGVTRSSMRTPRSVAIDSTGNLWVSDSGNNRVLRFSTSVLGSTNPEADLVVGQVDFTTAVPNRGVAISASGLDTPIGLTFDAQNNLFVADFNNTRVLKFPGPVGPAATASTVFGQANFTTRGVPQQATDSSLAGPTGIALDGLGNLYVAVPLDNRTVVFSATAVTGTASKDYIGQPGATSTLANANVFPQASATTLSAASDVKATPDGVIFVADTGNNRVLSIPSARSKTASQVWGQADFSSNGANQIKPGSINAPYRIAIDYSQEPFALYVSDTNNNRIMAWKDASRFHTGDPADFIIGQPGFNTAFANVDTRGGTTPSATSLSGPRGLAVDAAGNLYVADADNNRVLRYPRPVDQSGRIAPDLVIGQADFASATSAAVNASTLRSPSGLAIGPDGNLFISDNGNNRVLEFPQDGRTAIRVYGQLNFTSGSLPSSISAQTLAAPRGLYVDGASTLYVADSGANRVLIFSNTRNAPAAGAAASIVIGQAQFDQVSGGGGSTRFNAPADIVVDTIGNIYVSDNGNHRVLIFPSLLFLPFSGAAATAVVGQRDLGSAAQNWNTPDGLATPEGLSFPLGLYLDRRDTLYVGDTGNNRVVQFLKPFTVANAAHLQASAPVSRGAIVSIFGLGLADEQAKAPDTEWPSELAGREAVVNDEIRAAIGSVSPTQVNLQAPSASPLGLQRIVIRVPETGELIAGGSLLVAAASPGFYSTSNDGKGQGVVLNQDGTANGPANPAAKGTVIQLFGTGQGEVSPPVPDGTPAPADMPVNTVAAPTSDANTCINKQPAVCVAIGSTFGEIQFSGLAPGVIGVWQIKVKIPANALTGNAIPVRAVINAIPSNLVSVAIR